ncbi:13817_t:CDS:2 [Cetraspora pellucida]|uniref:13817_t:CDS:1 n=1 Tax=Cetraspora pellucida TaxID=1433469 RepID=A0ACA9MAA5_9GLOM|nr:13817_t:CDS:2 [Cetraspora pellucida]
MKFLATVFVLLATVAILAQASPFEEQPKVIRRKYLDFYFIKYVIALTETAVKKLNDTIKASKKRYLSQVIRIYESSIKDIYRAAYNVQKVAEEFVATSNRVVPLECLRACPS